MILPPLERRTEVLASRLLSRGLLVTWRPLSVLLFFRLFATCRDSVCAPEPVIFTSPTTGSDGSLLARGGVHARPKWRKTNRPSFFNHFLFSSPRWPQARFTPWRWIRVLALRTDTRGQCFAVLLVVVSLTMDHVFYFYCIFFFFW